MHGLLHHAPELILLNDGFGLGEVSEEGLEASFKYIKKYLKQRSRKTSEIDQLTDIFNRLTERSTPLINHRLQRVRPKSHCIQCGSNRHTLRSHPHTLGQYDVIANELIRLNVSR